MVICGRLKVSDSSRFTVMELKVLNSDLIVAKQAKLKFYSSKAAVLDLSKTSIFIYPDAKISYNKSLYLTCKKMENWGYVGSKDLGLNILAKDIINHGIIESEELNVRCSRLENK